MKSKKRGRPAKKATPLAEEGNLMDSDSSEEGEDDLDTAKNKGAKSSAPAPRAGGPPRPQLFGTLGPAGLGAGGGAGVRKGGAKNVNLGSKKGGRLKPGVAALREIKNLQDTTELLIKRLPFQRIVKVGGLCCDVLWRNSVEKSIAVPRRVYGYGAPRWIFLDMRSDFSRIEGGR